MQLKGHEPVQSGPQADGVSLDILQQGASPNQNGSFQHSEALNMDPKLGLSS